MDPAFIVVIKRFYHWVMSGIPDPDQKFEEMIICFKL